MKNFTVSQYLDATQQELNSGTLTRSDLWCALHYLEGEFYDCVKAMRFHDGDLSIRYAQDAQEYKEMCRGLRRILGADRVNYPIEY
jgi:hypothetical protein